MKFLRSIGLAALLMVGASGAWASEKAAITDTEGGGKTFAICSAETATGICENAANTQDIYAQVSRFNSFTVTFSETGGTLNECHIYIGDQVLAVSSPANLASIGQQITTIPLSASAPVFEFDFPVFWVWADCTASTGNFSVNLQARK
tara:strand:+ start:209 stop:652 length:444 start_codon:yes stop_codon:yes gene_type:complete